MTDRTHIGALRCEYLKNPIGIDVLQPRFFWQLHTQRRGARQSAYQILVASDEALLARDQGDLWDSGQVASDQCTHVVYEGSRLGSTQRAWWKVRAWDENEAATEYSEPAWWEMGLLERGDWKAVWIGASLAGGKTTPAPCPFLRHELALSQSVVCARLYVTALGLYEFYINGQQVGDDIFTPGWTDYRKRVQYQVYDVTPLLQAGQNALGAILGDGWYCGHVGGLDRQQYGDRPKLLAQLHLQLADGSTQIVTTDGSWKTATGPLLESDMIMGESYDARLQLEGWSSPGYDDSTWQNAITFPDPAILLSAICAPAVRRQEELTPVEEARRVAKNVWIFDLGQNMVGRVRLKVNGEAGTTLQLRHAEALEADGTLYTANLRTARATDRYTLHGRGEEIYEPHFTFHGFRYVELSGLTEMPQRDAVTGIVLHSALEQSGTFECSDPLVNQLQSNIRWGQKGNFLEVPTDCPQRNERMGWTGDAQVFIRTAAFNYDVASFFTKWQTDIADAQTQDGNVPCTVPSSEVYGLDGGPAWSDAIIICAWTIYQCYGDRRLLERHYESFVRFIAFLQSSSLEEIRCHPDDERKWNCFGDWLALDGSALLEGATPKDLIGTAFFAQSTHLLSRIATTLGKTVDAERYARLSGRVKAAFNRRFVAADGVLAGGTQTAYLLALQFDLLPQELRANALRELVRDIAARGWHLSTGFVGSPYINHVLNAMGRLDIAYQLLHQTTWPSWLYAVTQGATTIWERWDGWTHDKGFQDPAMNSFNHYAYGAIGAWLYQAVSGIEIDPSRPGYKNIILRPQPGGRLTAAKATYRSLYGELRSEWSLKSGNFHWSIVVPPNTTATIFIPWRDKACLTEGCQPVEAVAGIRLLRLETSAAVYLVQPGRYEFIVNDEALDSVVI